MDAIVRQGESFSYSDSDIKRLLDDDVTIMKYPQLAECKTVEDIFKGNSCACILYMTKQNFGHWTALIRSPGGQSETCEVFDPYGIVPDDELKYINEDFREDSNQVRQHLSHILHDEYKRGTLKEIFYNKFKLQSSMKDTNTCGRWCSIRCLLKGLSLEQFIPLFVDQTLPPDMIVTRASLLQL